MSTPSTRIGLNTFQTTDQFTLATYNANWNLLDDMPGIYICTSTTHPGAGGSPALGYLDESWGSAQTGLKIFETDTGLTWRWNGSAFLRDSAKGFLARVTLTSNQFTTDQWSPTAGGTYDTVLSTTVSCPANDSTSSRRIQVTAEIPEIQNPTVGCSWVILYKTVASTVSILNSWPVWTVQEESGGGSNPGSTPGSVTTYDTIGTSTTSVQYSLAISAEPGTSSTTTLVGAAARPIGLTIVEV